jgi:hypothetical protein
MVRRGVRMALKPAIDFWDAMKRKYF